VSVTETQPEPSGWSQATNLVARAASSSGVHRRASDEQLARAAGRGDAAAFELIYERHHRHLLSFSRHMVGGMHDAEDVVQHAFAAADQEFRRGRTPKSVRAWLYAVARNRCVSLLRARRDDGDLPDAGLPSTENLAAEVEQRADLRDLLADLRSLPDDQRAALLLSELDALSHADVAEVIGVRPAKVKALVFQARENLMAAADARSIPCRAIREELAVATGSALRRRHLRNHLARCEECSEFSARVRAQRASVAAILPVVPTIALRESVLGALGGGGAAATGAGVGVLAGGSTAAKVLAITAIGGAAVGGGTVAVTKEDRHAPRSERPAAVHARPAAAVPVAADRPPAVVTARELAPASAWRARVDAKAKRKPHAPAARPARERKGPERTAAPPGDRGRALGHDKQAARERLHPPGQLRRQASGKPTPPGQAKKAAPAAKKAAPQVKRAAPQVKRAAPQAPKLKPPKPPAATPAEPAPPPQAGGKPEKLK
jgi:RNA polymerase sigma factor (sigma-70 family)